MSNETDFGGSADPLATSGHVERTVLQQLVGDDGRYVPLTVGELLDPVAAVIERGDYANAGPRNGSDAGALVQQSTLRRTLNQLESKGLVRRVDALSPADLRGGRVDLGTLGPEGDPDDPASYSATSDDGRVTDWVLTDEGRREVARLDARYAAELDELAARYGRPRGETATRIDV